MDLFLRIIANAVLFFSILFLPWWFFALVGIGALVLFESFYELIIWGFFADALFGVQVVALGNFGLMFTLAGFVLFYVVKFLKVKVRWSAVVSSLE